MSCGLWRALYFAKALMKNQTLQYYMHDGPAAFRFELAGHLNLEGALRLSQDWHTASSVIGDRRLIVDITFLTSVDDPARVFIARWYREGARLVASSSDSRALAESILGEPLPEAAGDTLDAAASERTWVPFHTSLLASAVNLLLLFAAVLFPVEMKAATLKSQTVAAWDDYLQTVNANLEERVRPGGSFLWTLEDPVRAGKVRNREIVVVPAPGPNPKKVPGGLIHHWIGAVFLSNLKLNDILEVTRDYDRYKDFYRPSVVESKVIARNGPDDKFSILLMNKSLFLKTALDADCHAIGARLDERRFYSVSRTARVQEIEDYGQPGEHMLPEGEGGGYIWALSTIARFEQTDDGVYVEFEAIALSREIPAALRFVADPIVRRVSRNSLLASLEQTEEAVRGNFAKAASARLPADAEQMRSSSVPPSLKASAFAGVR